MKTPKPVLLLAKLDVADMLTLDECIAAVEKGFALYAQGKALKSALIHAVTPFGEFHVKAGGLVGERIYFTTKVGGGFFRNRTQFDLPNIIGLILLIDGTNGVPLAVLESGVITRLRTAAATAVAAKYLARSDSSTVTICGAGSQAKIQLRALTRVLPITRAFIWSRSGAEATAARLSTELALEIRAAPDLLEASQRSDVIVTCTPAHRWYLGRQHVRPGTFVAAVGADSPNKHEIEPELLAESSVVCDLVDQGAAVGDLHHAIEKKVMTRQDIRGELGEIIVGNKPGRTSNDETIVFDSTGTALQDAAAAAAVYEQAVAQGRGEPFGFWQ